jgi:hypothetical protein
MTGEDVEGDVSWGRGRVQKRSARVNFIQNVISKDIQQAAVARPPRVRLMMARCAAIHWSSGDVSLRTPPTLNASHAGRRVSSRSPPNLTLHNQDMPVRFNASYCAALAPRRSCCRLPSSQLRTTLILRPYSPTRSTLTECTFATMPPKQATLGYVKSSQTTLGCEDIGDPHSSLQGC